MKLVSRLLSISMGTYKILYGWLVIKKSLRPSASGSLVGLAFLAMFPLQQNICIYL